MSSTYFLCYIQLTQSPQQRPLRGNYLSSHALAYSGYFGNGESKYILFADWEIHIMENCNRGLNAVWGIFKSVFTIFTIRTDPKPVNNLFFSFSQIAFTIFFAFFIHKPHALPWSWWEIGKQQDSLLCPLTKQSMNFCTCKKSKFHFHFKKYRWIN